MVGKPQLKPLKINTQKDKQMRRWIRKMVMSLLKLNPHLAKGKKVEKKPTEDKPKAKKRGRPKKAKK